MLHACIQLILFMVNFNVLFSRQWEILDGWLGRKLEEDKGPGFMCLIFDKKVGL